MILLMWLLAPLATAFVSCLGILGAQKRRSVWISASIGGHAAFLLGVLLVALVFVTNGLTYPFLIYLDLFGRLMCGPVACEAYGFPYVLTAPASLCLLGALLGVLVSSIRNSVRHIEGRAAWAVSRLVLPLSMLNVIIAITPFAVVVVPQLWRTNNEARIIHSILGGISREAACEEIAVTNRSTCFTVAAIEYEDERICHEVFGPFPQFDERYRNTCLSLVREAKAGLLNRDSCSSPRISWHGGECWLWLGVYLQDAEVCRGWGGECSIYIPGEWLHPSP